jgi:hypothetical protein
VNWKNVEQDTTSSELAPAFSDVITGCLVAIKRHLLE